MPLRPTLHQCTTPRWAPALTALLTALTVAALTLAPPPLRAQSAPRVVSVGGALTEIVYALGAGETLVGVDTTSTHPEAAQALPQVGYQRTLSAEGILSLSPTLMLATQDAGPPEALQLVREAGVPIRQLTGDASAAGLITNIADVAAALNKPVEGRALVDRVAQQFQALRDALADVPRQPTTMFLLNVGQGPLLVSGTGTKAHAVINLAGGQNAITGYEGYKPLSAESAVAAAPEVLLMTTRGFEMTGGIEGLRKLPGLALTPALQQERVVHLDGLYLLGFGPRQPRAVRELALALHPDLSLPTLTARTDGAR